MFGVRFLHSWADYITLKHTRLITNVQGAEDSQDIYICVNIYLYAYQYMYIYRGKDKWTYTYVHTDIVCTNLNIYTLEQRLAMMGEVGGWGRDPKNVRGEIGGWGRVPFNEPYAPSLSTIYDGA